MPTATCLSSTVPMARRSIQPIAMIGGVLPPEKLERLRRRREQAAAEARKRRRAGAPLQGQEGSRWYPGSELPIQRGTSTTYTSSRPERRAY